MSWKKIGQIRSRAAAVLYSVTIRCDWMRPRDHKGQRAHLQMVVSEYLNFIFSIYVLLDETYENNGKPFQCYDIPYRVRAVSQSVVTELPTDTKSTLLGKTNNKTATKTYSHIRTVNITPVGT
jgi:hypothetical protein